MKWISEENRHQRIIEYMDGTTDSDTQEPTIMMSNSGSGRSSLSKEGKQPTKAEEPRQVKREEQSTDRSSLETRETGGLIKSSSRSSLAVREGGQGTEPVVLRLFLVPPRETPNASKTLLFEKRIENERGPLPSSECRYHPAYSRVSEGSHPIHYQSQFHQPQTYSSMIGPQKVVYYSNQQTEVQGSPRTVYNVQKSNSPYLLLTIGQIGHRSLQIPIIM